MHVCSPITQEVKNNNFSLIVSKHRKAPIEVSIVYSFNEHTALSTINRENANVRA